MPARQTGLRGLYSRVRFYARVNAPWRRLNPNRVVKRTVQGTTMYLNWSHLLPDYAEACPQYGQNLVQLAVNLERESSDGFRFLDVGANIGDSTMQILSRVEGKALCVDADPVWLELLNLNVGEDPRVTVVAGFVVPAAADSAVSPVRVGGTTRFVANVSDASTPESISAVDLRTRYPEFDRVRLIKSDTDGFDVVLVPALIEAWSDVRPVVFFEFDPGLSRLAGNDDPHGVWDRLAELGYEHLIVWDNIGDLLGRLATSKARTAGQYLEPRPTHLGYHFWDVAACHVEDHAALATFERLSVSEFNPNHPGPRG